MKISNIARKTLILVLAVSFAVATCYGGKAYAAKVSGCKGNITITAGNCTSGCCCKGDEIDVTVYSDKNEDLRNLKASWGVNDTSAVYVTPEGYSASLKSWMASVKILKAGTHKYGQQGFNPTVYAVVNGVKLSLGFFVYPSGEPQYVCDTTDNFSVKRGALYQFMVTAEKEPSFTCGSKTFKIVSFSKESNKYFFKVKAVGCKGNGCGFYINSSKTPVVIANIV